MYKELHSVAKWSKNLNSYFSKENIQVSNRYRKRCSEALVVGELHIKITQIYHFTLLGWLLSEKEKREREKSVGKDMEALESMYMVGENVK